MSLVERLKELIMRGRHNRKVLLFIVYIALFLDNMLLTTVVPIIPEYLIRLQHPNATDDMIYRRFTTPSPITSTTTAVGQIEYEQDYTSSYYGDEYQWSTDTTPPNATVPSVVEERHEMIAQENVLVGLLFGSKALIQLIANPFVGPLTNTIGYTIPMFTGFVVMALSTIMFSFGNSYGVLWFARALQGIGSACTSTSGMGMLAQAYPDDEERGSAMGIALGGLALGVLVGPPYGGLLYQWSGKELPFLILACLAIGDGALQFLVLQPHVDKGEPEGTSIKVLIKDPYIIIAAGSITIGNLGIAMLEPSLPLWMMETMRSRSIARGAAFLPASASYLIGTNIFGPLAHKIGRWLSGMIGLIMIGLSLLAIPTATSVGGLVIPMGFLGFGIGMIDASMFPAMGHLVDIRHVGVYGSIYAIADAAFCFAFALGPFLSGPLVKGIGFPAMMYLIAGISLVYAPLMFFLRNPPPMSTEDKKLLEQDHMNTSYYQRFDNEYTAIEGEILTDTTAASYNTNNHHINNKDY